jgi:pyridoxamine 5'-phosphate oxidase
VDVDLTGIRREYERAGLAERDVDPSPMKQVERWLEDAVLAKHPEPTAMLLATVDTQGDLAARVVLVRGVTEEGLVFYTNYDSDKGKELEACPRAAGCFYWVLLERQLRVVGSVTKVTREESEAYFRGRPRESQIGAWASRQSAVLAGREELERQVAEARARFEGTDVPCPPGWGGYRLSPHRVELWQGRPSRLHDRLRYTRLESGPSWRLDRLSP